jgi:N-acetylglucosamine transport system permease protein
VNLNRYVFGKFLSHAALIIWSISIGMLVYFMIISAMKTNRTVFRQLWSLPEKLNITSFINAWSNLDFGRYTFNSVIVVLAAVALIIIISAPASYALTKMKMRFAQPITFFYIAGIGVPFQLLLIPVFKVLASLNLVDSLLGLVVVYTVFSIPFTVFLLTGFFLSIPSELEDSAYVDGCNEFQTFFKIMVPMATPGIVTAGIFNFISLWNEYLLALVFTSSSENRTLSLGLYSLYSSLQYTSDWVTIFAASVLSIIPTMILFIFLSEKLIAGITLGSLK